MSWTRGNAGRAAVVPIVGAALSGMLYALALPPHGWWPLGWVCLVPLMLAVRGRRWWQVAALSWLAGWTYAVLTGWWVWVGAHYYFGASRPASTSFILFVLGPACGAGVLVAGCVAEWVARGRAPVPRTFAWLLAWTLGEGVRVAGPLAMPWCLLGATQLPMPIFLQVADLGGTLLLGALVAAVNACLAEAIARPRVRPRYVGCAVALFVAITCYGGWRLGQARDTQNTPAGIAVAIVQGNIPQQERWRHEDWPKHTRIHANMTYRARAAGAEVIVWPETSAGERRMDLAYFGADLGRIAGPECTLMAGCIGLDGSPARPDTRRYNVLLSTTQDDTAHVYRKRRLVPFGERVPAGIARLDFLDMRRSFPRPLHPGPEPPELLQHAGRPVGAMICYEYLYPDTLVSTIRAGAQWVAIVSNDAWYDTTSAPIQHHAQVALAAVATRRYVIRATNTGLSGAFDPWGRPLPFEAGELADPPVAGRRLGYAPLPPQTTTLPLRRAGWGIVRVHNTLQETLFVRYGNWPLSVASIAIILYLLLCMVLSIQVFMDRLAKYVHFKNN